MNEQGVILFETLALTAFLFALVFLTHLRLAGIWRRELIILQDKRISYDGIRRWK